MVTEWHWARAPSRVGQVRQESQECGDLDPWCGVPDESRVELCWVYTLCMRAMMASPAEDSTRPFRSMSAGHKEATWPSGVGAEERKERADRRLDVTWKPLKYGVAVSR